MSIGRQYCVLCDHCRQRAPWDADVEGARKKAKEYGWTELDDIAQIHFCPECPPEDE